MLQGKLITIHIRTIRFHIGLFVLENTKNVQDLTYLHFFRASLDVIEAAKSDDNLARLEETSLGVTGLIGDVVAAVNQLPGGGHLKLIDDDNLQSKAEMELANALKTINEASLQVKKNRPNYKPRDPNAPLDKVRSALFNRILREACSNDII